MNYDRYFNRGQKVFLINMSASRDLSVYESFSGTVVSSDDTHITLKAPYRIFSGDTPSIEAGMLFKLTTESFGMGIQLCGELISTPGQETLTVRPLGNMEIYQRRQSVRVDLTLPCLHVPQKSSLQAFKREWRRVVDDLHKPNPPRLKLQPTVLNISAGGVRFDLVTPPTALSIVVIDLQDEQPPICTVAELVWQKSKEDADVFICGHRFLEILKDDQERLADFVAKKVGGTAGRLKDNWILQDRMMHPLPEPGQKE